MPEYYEIPDASPFDDILAWIPLVLTAIDDSLNTELAFPNSWDTARGKIQDLLAYFAEFEPMSLTTGTITAFAGVSAPEGWLLCHGQAISRDDYGALFDVIGTTYGAGNGTTTFNVPDARGRTGVGAGQGAGLTSRALGAMFGTETHTLTTNEIPSHSHTSNGTLNYYAAGYHFVTSGGIGYALEQRATNATGGDGAHNNIQPSLALNYIIKA